MLESKIEFQSVFCHVSQTPDRQGLIKGSKVSFVYQEDEKGGKALQVQIEEAAEEDTSPREVCLDSSPLRIESMHVLEE